MLVQLLVPLAVMLPLAAVDRARRSANVIAIEPVEALVIDTIYFEPFLKRNPSVAVAILRSVVGHLRDLQARIEGS